MFQVPKTKKSVKQNRFDFAVGAEKFSIPLLKFAPVESAELFEQGKNVAGVLACCENDAAKAAIRSMDGDQFGALMTAWSDASGVSVGESEASSDS